MFGSELSSKAPVHFSGGQKGSIITIKGCDLRIKGDDFQHCVISFEDDQCIPNIYMNLHVALEVIRSKAVANDEIGPRVVVCGHEGVGKASLCRTLVNYAVRRGRKVMLVDLDCSNNQLCVPGTLCTIPVTKPYDLNMAWSNFEEPLVFNYGHFDPSENFELFNQQTRQLAELIDIRSENDSDILTG